MPEARITVNKTELITGEEVILRALVTIPDLLDYAGWRRATYYIEPDPEEGISPSRPVVISFYNRGESALADACRAVERLLKI